MKNEKKGSIMAPTKREASWRMMVPSQMAPCKGKSESMTIWIFIFNVGKLDNLFSKIGYLKKSH